MQKAFISPGKYIQGTHEINNIANYTSHYGKNIFILISNSNLKSIKESLNHSFKNTDAVLSFELFNKECTQQEIDRIILLAKGKKAEVIIGIGGGKTLDTAKAAASKLNVPVIIVPTIASTDAPCSSLSVIYDQQGVFEKIIYFNKNPEVVLVDTELIARAPVKFLITGMGDALSTYFEARACRASYANNITGFKQTKTAFALSKLCYKILLEDSVNAIASCEANVVTPALENIIEANILLSGLGFESGGLAAAHSIHNGFSILEECHHLMHGDKVAFGVLVQLVLENAPNSEISTVVNYCLDVGLPVCLNDLKCGNVSENVLMKVAIKASNKEESIHNMPFKITPQEVFAAILTADRIGKKTKEKLKIDKI
jgi:glycerol dehydrogenase